MDNEETILVIGATGLLGKIAAEQFLSDGYKVKALVRNTNAAKNILPKEIELIRGDVTQYETVLNAAKDVDYIHISISGGNDSKDILKVELEGIRNVIKAAQKQNVTRISMISGMSVNAENQLHPSEKAKFLAEQDLEISGVKYTIFKPSFFMETLQRFVQKNKALLWENKLIRFTLLRLKI
ncbi:MAG TPA: NAD(P)H-binding protein [Ginsengibacter sp.]